MKSLNDTHILHNIAHFVLPLVTTPITLLFYPYLDSLDVLIVALFGGLVPDIDHVNIWFEYKFVNFRSFVKFVTKARRYRYSFLVFHNLGSVIAIVLLIPILNVFSPLGAVFLTAFLGHLLLDFIDDKISIGRVTHWRYRKKT